MKLLPIFLIAALSAIAQPTPGADFGRGGRGGPGGPPPFRWWFDPGVVRRIGLSPDQQMRIDRLFQQSRVRLIDLSAALEKEEAILDPMLEADRLDEARTAAQIDRVANARAELEKANGRMLLGMRGVLTPDQWKRLQADARPQEPPREGPPRDGRRGPPPE